MNVTKEQLDELTDEFNSRLAEFNEPGVTIFDKLSRGQVRLLYGVVCEKLEAWDIAIETESLRRDVAMDAETRTDAYGRGFEAGRQWGGTERKLDQLTNHLHDQPETVTPIKPNSPYGQWIQAKSDATAADGYDHDAEAELHASYSDDYTDADRKAIEADLFRPYLEDDDEDTEDVPLGPDFDGGFYTQTPDGHTIHINGDPDMSEETAQALREMADKVARKLSEKDLVQVDTTVDKIEAKNVQVEPAPIPAATAATLGPEHVVVTPLRSPIGPARLTDPDDARAKLASAVAEGEGGEFDFTPHHRRRLSLSEQVPPPAAMAKGRRGNVLPTIDQLIAEVRRQAAGTKDMPTKPTFDAAKPANWATAAAQLVRLNITWEQLAERAGLTVNPRGQRTKTVA